MGHGQAVAHAALIKFVVTTRSVARFACGQLPGVQWRCEGVGSVTCAKCRWLPSNDQKRTADSPLAAGSPFQQLALWDWDLRDDTVLWGSRPELWNGLGRLPPCTRADWLGLLSADDAAIVQVEQDRALRSGRPRWRVEYGVGLERARCVEEAFVARDEGGPARVVGTLSMLNRSSHEVARPTLGERLEHSEERFRTFVETIPQLAWQANPDGWIYFYNQRWYAYTGTTLEQMEGWGWVTVHDPHDLPRILKVFRRALEIGEPWEDEFRLRRGSDGMLRWHLSRAMPLRDRDGKIVQWFGTNTDVHDQKLALEERSALLAREREARKQAEEANRGKDEFLAVVSHELRTPLNAILGWSQLLQNQGLPPDKRRNALSRIESSARMQAKLIEDLLDVSRIIGGKLQIDREPVDLSRIMNAAIESLQPLAQRRGVELVLDPKPPQLSVEGSASRLQQVVANLVDNAIKFSDPGQRVTISLVREGADARIDVTDRGLGIEPAFLPRLFERFGQADSSTTRRSGGLGLGLSIVRHLVALHDGRVEAHSDGPGHGARFTVRLPRKGATGEVPRVEDSVAPTTLTGLDVLAVDDDETARDVLGAILLDRGASVTLAGSAAEALTALRTKSFDVVVSDIGMPDVDGFALAARIRSHPRAEVARLPLVALTAYASVGDRDRALAQGFDAYVAKPIETAALIRSISVAIRSRGLG